VLANTQHIAAFANASTTPSLTRIGDRSYRDSNMLDAARVHRPSVDEFWARVAERRPFVMTGLFADGQPIHDIATFGELERRYGDVPLPFIPPFDEKRALALAGLPAEEQQLTIGEYAALLRSGATPKLYSVPYGTPPGLESLLDVEPIYCAQVPQPSRLPTKRQLHMSGPGGATLLHFDGFGGFTIHHEIFGTKRWTLLPPEAGAQLSPCAELSLIGLHQQSAADKRSFVERLGGVQIDLKPGESLYFPPEWWHQVEYHEPACGVSFIFGRNLFALFFVRETHRNYMMGQILAKLAYESETACKYLPELIEFQSVCRRDDLVDPRQRYHAVLAAIRRMYLTMVPGGITHTHPILERVEERIALEQDGFYGEFRTHGHAFWREKVGLPLFDFWPRQA
jgi:hypothetical protein